MANLKYRPQRLERVIEKDYGEITTRLWERLSEVRKDIDELPRDYRNEHFKRLCRAKAKEDYASVDSLILEELSIMALLLELGDPLLQGSLDELTEEQVDGILGDVEGYHDAA